MKYFYVLFLLFIAGLMPGGYVVAQDQGLLSCNCSEIGIDSTWAESGNVICYKIRVDQTFDKRENGKITLAAIYAKRTGSKDAGPLLYLHGGPGLSTLSNAKRYLDSKDWKRLREEHDLIMFDYRGTGFSGPSVCENILDSLMSFKKTNPSPGAYQKKELELYLQCRNTLAGHNMDINSFNSVQMAADADAIREALHIKDWNVYGVSYGTMVGLHYIRSFPAHLRSVVLDSPFPPNASSFDFVNTMNESLSYMQERLLQDSLTAKKFPGIINDFSVTAARLNKTPVKVAGMDFTGEDFAWAMLMSFYDTKLVHLIPLALQEFSGGNDLLLSIWVEHLSGRERHGKPNPIQGALITCYECKPRKQEDSPDSLEAKYPYLASLSGKAFMNLCFQFRPEGPGDAYFEAVKSDLPVLVIGGEFDPGTPPSYGRFAVQGLTNFTLIAVPNASHAAMHYNDCSFNLVRSFLQNPARKPDTRCLENIEKLKFATKDLGEELRKVIKKK
ncbi:alpha/beta hydrolase [Niabella hirudinis]|uniref:alpha/beta hydrolase n=1 Tax=Niabella hirudinis TaxID=1285929 RepID=UPI003EBA8578